jgi:sugar lactone lactonase YvrE
LPKAFNDPRKELPYSGVFRVSPDGKSQQLVTTELSGPNGLAFSPDEKYFYVDNWDEKKVVALCSIYRKLSVWRPTVDDVVIRIAEKQVTLRFCRSGNPHRPLGEQKSSRQFFNLGGA